MDRAALVVASIACGALGLAQPQTARADASAGASPAVAPGGGSQTGPSSPSLASVDPPGPARSPLPRTGPAYRLDPALDIAALGISTGITLGWLFGPELAPPWCAPVCDPGPINALDRSIAGTYDRGWKLASDVGIAGLLVGGGLTVLLHDGLVDGLNDGVVVAQAVMISEMAAVLSNTSTRRPRPFVYGDEAPLDERMGGSASLSFFSGHTAASFATVVVTARTLERRGDGAGAAVVAAVGIPTASVVALGRVLSGYHFPTDVLTGAGVGTAIGLLLPAVHADGARVVPMVSSEVQGVSWLGSF